MLSAAADLRSHARASARCLRPALLRLGHRQCRLRQDACADAARDPPAALRRRSRGDPLPDLHQDRRGGDGAPRVRARSANGRCSTRRSSPRRSRRSRDARPPRQEMRQARRLFAKALETPGGLKIQTIHAFCERLLHEFPFEANVPGQFAVMDDSAAAARARPRPRRGDERAAAAEPESPPRPRRAAAGRARRRHADRRGARCADRAARRSPPLDRAVRAGRRGGQHRRRARRSSARGSICAMERAEESICREICQARALEDASTAASSSEASADSSNKTDREREQRSAVDCGGRRACSRRPPARIDFFLTGRRIGRPEGAQRSAPLRRSHPSRPRRASKPISPPRRSACWRSCRASTVARAYDATEALLIVGDAILQAYHVAKRQAGALDFPDLIAKARNLLSRSDAAQWVLFKLDRRVDHILVDEAQDTSPDQWKVVKAIAEDFFSGEGVDALDPHDLRRRRRQAVDLRLPGRRACDAGRRCSTSSKEGSTKRRSRLSRARCSSRSARRTRCCIAVDTVFGKQLAGEITASTYEAHATNRPTEPGHVVAAAAHGPAKDGGAGGVDRALRLRRARRRRMLANNIADEIARIRETRCSPPASDCATARS